MKMLQQRVGATTPVFGPKGCIEALESIFMSLYPVFFRWMNLFQLKQNGDTNISFLEWIYAASLEANFETLDHEGFCLLHFAISIKDDKLREKIVALEKLTYATAAHLVIKYDATQISTKAIKKMHHPDAITAFQPPNKPDVSSANRQRKACNRCRSTSHASSQC